MRRTLLWMLALMMGSVCQAEDITIRYNGATAKVTQQKKDSVNVTIDGAKGVELGSENTNQKRGVQWFQPLVSLIEESEHP